MYSSKNLHFLTFWVLSTTCVWTVDQEEKITFRPDDNWSSWEKWTTCSQTKFCWAGHRYRKRKCLKSTGLCTGIFMESEDCPAASCEDPPQSIISDVTEATSSSFISQECDTDIKFSLVGTHAHQVPQFIRSYFVKFRGKFERGYFNTKTLIGVPEKHVKSATKYCFEPWHITLREAKQIFRFNRITKSSLYIDESSVQEDVFLAGISMVMNLNNRTLDGIYFAVKSSKIGYRSVSYRRWRGQGFYESFR